MILGTVRNETFLILYQYYYSCSRIRLCYFQKPRADRKLHGFKTLLQMLDLHIAHLVIKGTSWNWITKTIEVPNLKNLLTIFPCSRSAVRRFLNRDGPVAFAVRGYLLLGEIRCFAVRGLLTGDGLDTFSALHMIKTFWHISNYRIGDPCTLHRSG